ncbi:MAG: class IV adenylate cyclase [Candidatus Heimdallarchaeota archaeon]
MIEVEIKVANYNPDLLYNKITELNGKYIISLNHEDTYFNMPKGLRDFKKTDEALRLREAIEFNKNKDEKPYLKKFYITYKGKRIDQTTKTREEIETEIKDIRSMRNLLSHLGFKEILTVKKERELYEFWFKNKKIDLLLDYLPILNQNFIEAEIQIEDKIEMIKSKDLIFDFLKQFGITEEDSIRDSYLELIAKKLSLK